MKNAIKQRTSQWWHPKAGIILSAVYLSVLINKVSFTDLLAYFIPAVTTILGIGVFGYFINDFFDRKSDEKAQKTNMLSGRSPYFMLSFLLVVLFLALLPWVMLPYNLLSFCFLSVEFALLLIYAAPPFRLKEKGFVALVADALYAYIIPFLLAFHTFSLLGDSSVVIKPLYLCIFFWLLLVGVYNMAIHQLDDYENDKASLIKTWVIYIGKENALSSCLSYIWPIKMLAFFIFSIVLYIYHPIAGISLSLISIIKLGWVLRKGIRAHYTNREPGYLQRINFHYHLWLPYLFLGLLSITDYLFVIVGAAHFILFRYGFLFTFFRKYLIPFVSYVVNYFIYYLFLLFGVDLKKENKSALKYLKGKLN